MSQLKYPVLQLTDTLPLQTEDDNYQRVTIETNIIKSYVMQTEIKRRVIGSQGQILESSTDIVSVSYLQ